MFRIIGFAFVFFALAAYKALYILHIHEIYVIYMVQAVINISKKANHVLNIVKAKNRLKDKSEAINFIAMGYAEEVMEPELRPEFIGKMQAIAKEKSVEVGDFKKRYGLK